VNPSRPFILRPIATSLLMAGLLIAGVLGLQAPPVSALPQVDYPTIQVITFYPGASPDVMASAVTAPLERQFGQLPGLNQMTSTSSDGSSVITLQFALELNIDVAEQEVQAAINASGTYLPRDLPNPPIYSKTNPADAPILTLALTSDTLPLAKVEDFADTRFAQKISQLPGVGLVSISGGQKPAVRVQVNPTALSSYGLTVEDVRTAIAQANVNQAKGSFDGPRELYAIAANDQLLTSEQYKPLVIAYRNGAPVRLSDVAAVVDSAENLRQAAWMNETPAVIMNIQRQPGANIIAVVDRVKALLPQLRASLPASVKVQILTDRTTTIRASVEDVEFELLLTIALVVMVIFLFLRTLAATVIPSVAVPLSLLGTFGVMYLLGYSLNNLTLMALTIATGFVVDDAIVMIENITRYIEEGDPPLEAALKGAEQIGFTILSLTVSLIAVLIPLLFMGDVVGRLFREFAITLSVTILVSAVVSLTLTPMMCAKLLRHRTPRSRDVSTAGPSGAFERIIARYGRMLTWVLDRQPRPWSWPRSPGGHRPPLRPHPEGLLPRPGHGRHPRHLGGHAVGLVPGHGRAPAGAGARDPEGPGGGQPLVVHRDRRHQHHDEQRAHPDQPQAAGGPRRQRDRDHPAAAARAGERCRDHPLHAAGAGPHGGGPHQPDAIPVQPRGSGRARAGEWVPAFHRPPESPARAARRGQRPAERGAAGPPRAGPRDRVTPRDHAPDAGRRALRLLRPAPDLDMFTQLNQYRVVLEVGPDFSKHPDNLQDVYLRSTEGGTVPLASFTNVRLQNAPLVVNHQGPVPGRRRCRSTLLPNASLGDAVSAIDRAKDELQMPASIQAEFQGTARAFQASLANQPLLILAAIVTVYILLGILYESYIHPVTILSTLPSAGVGALLSLMLFRIDFSVIALIGIILLIGIVEKNAIMMIDFALDAERKEGKPPEEAIYQAALLRFRPILMTTMAALFAGVPLALGTGIGSELRRPAGHRDRGRAHLQPDAHAVHHARDLPGLRPAGPARHEAGEGIGRAEMRPVEEG
jgi:multidrug efflux pump